MGRARGHHSTGRCDSWSLRFHDNQNAPPHSYVLLQQTVIERISKLYNGGPLVNAVIEKEQRPLTPFELLDHPFPNQPLLRRTQRYSTLLLLTDMTSCSRNLRVRPGSTRAVPFSCHDRTRCAGINGLGILGGWVGFHPEVEAIGDRELDSCSLNVLV